MDKLIKYKSCISYTLRVFHAFAAIRTTIREYNARIRDNNRSQLRNRAREKAAEPNYVWICISDIKKFIAVSGMHDQGAKIALEDEVRIAVHIVSIVGNCSDVFSMRIVDISINRKAICPDMHCYKRTSTKNKCPESCILSSQDKSIIADHQENGVLSELLTYLLAATIVRRWIICWFQPANIRFRGRV